MPVGEGHEGGRRECVDSEAELPGLWSGNLHYKEVLINYIRITLYLYPVLRPIDLPSKFTKAPYCVQRYITRPLLINKTKFDLRLYVLLTSIDPIRQENRELKKLRELREIDFLCHQLKRIL